MTNRTIRLFVSSTFSDFKAERDLLQREVFPKLQQLCLSKGLRFQAIDLRWGVPEEAGKDNRTMRICLRELKRCQEGEIKPNFLVMLGDRYGWRPLPETIPAEVFGEIRRVFTTKDTKSTKLLDAWYRRDDNAVPAEYVLKPRTGRFEDFVVWQREVEQPLLAALEQYSGGYEPAVAEDEGGAGKQQARSACCTGIGLSATHQEIFHGALALPKAEARAHVHVFRRGIVNPPSPPRSAFVDCRPDGTPDPDAPKGLASLCVELDAHLGKDNLHNYTVRWCDENLFKDEDLESFAADVFEVLKKVIAAQVAALNEVPREDQEEQAHHAFCEERRSGFIGRNEPLAAIESYLRAGSPHPLAIIGPAGSGKSALLAEAVHRARSVPKSAIENQKSEIISRFIGVTPGSSDLLELLRELVARIRARYPREVGQGGTGVPPVATEASHEPSEKEPDDRDIPNEINPLTMAFHEALGRATAERPLWLFLDALDQFRDVHLAGSLSWLPQKLPEHVRIVVSAAEPSTAGAVNPLESSRLVAPAVLSDPRAMIIRNLARIAPGGQTLRLDPLTTADGAELLDRWLAAAGRTLDESQRKPILDAFAVEGNALWLRVAAEEAARWPRWHKPVPLPTGLPDLLFTVLERLSRNEEHGVVFVKRALGYLACARHGLAEDEIIGVLGADPTVMADIIARSPTERVKAEADRIKALPVAIWVRFHGDIAFYLSERRAQGAALFGFYHRSFGEAVEQFCLKTDTDRLPLHETMARWFGEQPWFLPPAGEDGQPPRVPERSDPANTRKTSEVPFHLQRVAELEPVADRWDPLVDVLCDLDCVETKARSGLIYELVGDYNAAFAELPEFRDENERLAKRDTAMIAYNQALREYAVVRCDWWFAKERGEVRPEPEYPQLPAELENQAERAIPEESSERAALLRHFASFVSIHVEQLTSHPAEMLPIAFDYADDGPVHRRAEILLNEYSRPWLRRLFRPPYQAVMRRGSRIFHGHSGKVLSVDYCSIRKQLLSASADNTLRLWDPSTGECLRVFRKGGTYVVGARISPDGLTAVSVGQHDTNLSVWDIEKEEHIRTIEVEKYGSWVSDVSISNDGCKTVTVSSGQNLRCWNFKNGNLLRHIECPMDFARSRVEYVVCSPDGKRCVTSGQGVSCCLWDITTGKCLHDFGELAMNTGRVAISADGRYMASPGYDSSVRLWDIETGDFIHVFEGHSGRVLCLDFSPDGHRLISGSEDHSLRLWDIKNKCELGVLGYHEYAVLSTCYCRDGRHIVSGSVDNTMRLWEVKAEANPTQYLGYGVGGVSISMSLDGSRAVSLSYNLLTIWSAESGEPLQRFAIHNSSLISACLSSDGQRVFIGCRDGIGVCSLQNGRYTPILAIDIRGPWAHAVCVSSDGRRAVSASWDNVICVWNMEAKRLDRVISHNGAEVLSVSIDAGGQHILTAHAGNTLHLWDAITGTIIKEYHLQGDIVRNANISPDACWAVVVGTDKNLHLFNLQTGAWQAHYRSHVCVRSGAISMDLSRIVCGTEDGQMHFLTPINFPPSGPPILTAVRLWLFGDNGAPGRWDEHVTALCPCCGRRFPVRDDMLGQQIACPMDSCGKPLQLNPFVASSGPSSPSEDSAPSPHPPPDNPQQPNDL